MRFKMERDCIKRILENYLTRAAAIIQYKRANVIYI